MESVTVDTADIPETAETKPVEPLKEPDLSEPAPVKKKRKKSRKKVKPKGLFLKYNYVHILS